MKRGKASGGPREALPGNIERELAALLSDLREVPPRHDLQLLTERLKAALKKLEPPS